MTFKAPAYEEPHNPVGTVAELFAGVGGFRVGLARAGWKTVYSNQWEPSTKTQHASDVYEHRFGAAGHSKLSVFEVDEIPVAVDLLVGGFPCQDYSVAKARGAALGLEGVKGVLWWEIVRLLASAKPPFVLLENVDRLLKSPISNRGRDFAIMLASFGMLGYDVEWRVINAADYGFPQRRKRVFILASEAGTNLSSAEDSIFSSGALAQAFPVEPDVSGILEMVIGKQPDVVSASWSPKSFPGFPNAGVYRAGTAHLASVRPDYRGPIFTLRSVLEQADEIDPSFRVDSSLEARWAEAKGGKKIQRISKSTGFAYTYSEGAMAFPDDINRPSRTILTAEGGTTPSRFKHIIQDEIGLRRLTPLELERLSGFPDHWTSEGKTLGPLKDTRRAFLIGNALVVGLVEAIGRYLRA